MARCWLLLPMCCVMEAPDAGNLRVVVQDAKQHGIAEVVVIATAAAPATPAPAPVGAALATMDQRDLAFVPEVLVVRTGTAISFPNHDVVKHQVYSFSPAKTFQLPLYVGKAHPPILFDKPGIVTIGCNIHDSMLGFIYVTDSPWFARTDSAGVAQLAELPAGSYDIVLWHPRQTDSPAKLRGTAQVEASGTAALQFVIPSLRPSPNRNSTRRMGY